MRAMVPFPSRYRRSIKGIISKRRDLNMEHRGLAVVERGKTAVDRGGEIVGFGDAFAMRAECAADVGKTALLALTARCQSRLKLVGLRGGAIGINPLYGGFHRLPAAIVEHNGQNPDLILLR